MDGKIFVALCILFPGLGGLLGETNDDDEQRIHENFRELFEGASKNDPTRIKAYEEVLQNDRRSQDDAFDAMKKEMGLARRLGNGHKRIEKIRDIARARRNLQSTDKPDFGKYEDVSRLIGAASVNEVKRLVNERKLNISQPDDECFGNSPIHEAARLNRLDILRYFIEEEHGDLNIRNEFGEPPIFVAADNNHHGDHDRIVKYLVKQGANITMTDCHKNNVLYNMARKGAVALAQFVLDENKAPLSVNWRNNLNMTLVHYAAKFNQLTFLKYLIGQKKADIHALNASGHTAVHMAARANNLEVLKYLFKQGANPDPIDKFGKRPAEMAREQNVKNARKYKTKRWRGLSDAVVHNDLDAVKYWIEVKGASLTGVNTKGDTVAHLAARNDNLSILEYLLQRDATKYLFKKADQKGLSIFHVAASHGAMKVIRHLMNEHSEDVSVAERTRKPPQNYAVHLAAGNGQLSVLKYLIEEKSVDVNTQNSLLEPPLFLAIRNQHLDVIRYIVERPEVNLRLTDTTESTILHVAVISCKNDTTVVEYLLGERHVKVDVNAKNKFGDTALLKAAALNYLGLVEYLLRTVSDVDINISDVMNKTPLYHAAVFGHVNVVKVLVEHGADAEIKDCMGQTPVEATQCEEVIVYLKKIKRSRPQ